MSHNQDPLKLRDMFKHNFENTKRLAGFALLGLSIAAALAVLLVDRLGAGQDSGFGPLQVMALIAGGLAALLGVILLLFGERINVPPDLAGLSPEWLRTASIVLYGLALLAFLAYFVLYLNYAIALFRFPFDYDQGEGFELTDTIIHSQGGWPYRDVGVFPFYASNYPPLYHLMVVPLVWIFGPHYWTGRALGFAMTLVGAGAIGWAVYRDGTQNWLLATLAGLAFLASNIVYHVGPLFRQHMSMVTFETLAVVTLAALPDQERGFSRRLWVALLFLLMAGFTKQLALWTTIAFFVWLSLRGFKRAILAGLLFSAVAGGLFLAINAATDGYWWLHTISANVNEYMPEQFRRLLLQFIRLHAVLIAFALGMLASDLYALRQSVKRLSVYSVWFVFSLINAVMAGKWGAGESYYATSIAAACILTGIAMSRLLRVGATRPGRWARGLVPILAILLLIQARLVLHMPTDTAVFATAARMLGARPDGPYFDSTGYTQLGRPPTQADIKAGQRIAAYVAEGPLPALSEEAGFCLYAGKPVVTNPTQLLNLYHNGLYDPEPLVQMIEEQKFNVVVLRATFYPEPVIDAIGQAYQPAEYIVMNGFPYGILKPQARDNKKGAISRRSCCVE